MKIVQINAVCGFGSTGRIVDEISDFLTERGVENIILYGQGTSDRANAKKIGTDTDHKCHALLSRITGRQGYFSKSATKRILKYIRDFAPDIIHLHNLHSNFINLPELMEYAINAKCAVVITLHDCWFFTGNCTYYSIAGCEKWKYGCGQCPQLKRGNKSWFFDRTKSMLRDKSGWYEKIDRLGVIGVSGWITGEAEHSVMKNAYKLATIYNWVDLDVFYPHKTDIRKRLNIKSKYIILGVSIAWTKEKGADDFNKLAGMLDEDFTIVLVGKAEAPMNKRIYNIPRTNDINMLSDIYADADVFYNPTRRETFGKVTAEALACGTPVIAYNTTACTELVPADCGYIEQTGDIEAVKRDIYKIINGKTEYQTNCRRFAEDKFDKNKRLEDTLRLYNELIME